MDTTSRRRRALLAGGALLAAATLAGSPAVLAQDPLKATYVSTGPIGVDPFLELIADGLTRAGEEFGVETSVTESTDIAALEDNLRFAIEDGNDLIVANSFDSVDAITRLSAEFPDQQWALVDTGIDGNDKVRGLVFKEHEGAYLVGVIFGLLSTGEYEGYPASDTFGAVGAFDLPFIRRWFVGFEEGVKSVKPDANVLLQWSNSWNDPATSKELALAQVGQGAPYIFAFAASGNFGIFEAAKEQGFFTSGVDKDQRPLDPEHILESVVKRTDVGVYDSVKDLAGGAFSGGYRAYGLAENGVGPAFILFGDELDPPSVLPQEVQDQVRAVADRIVSGELVVTDYLAQPAPSTSPAS
jgi:basic membrane protein A